MKGESEPPHTTTPPQPQPAPSKAKHLQQPCPHSPRRAPNFHVGSPSSRTPSNRTAPSPACLMGTHVWSLGGLLGRALGGLLGRALGGVLSGVLAGVLGEVLSGFLGGV